MLTTTTAFERYQQIRPRLPAADTGAATREIDSLLEIAEEADAFVFDAFGVLNVGDTPIPGAARRLAALRAGGAAIRILTNAASYDREGAVAKFRDLGIPVEPDEIVTSRDAALAALDTRLWGVIAAPEDALGDIAADTIRLGDDPAAYERAEGILFLSSGDWNDARQALLEASLADRPRPVMIANADLVAPRGEGMTLEPGHYGHRVADRIATPVRFFGKPFAEVYERVEAGLPGVAPASIVMCGDTLHTDIVGAAARGWRTALVTRDGMFAGHDVAEFCDASGIHPDWRLARI